MHLQPHLARKHYKKTICRFSLANNEFISFVLLHPARIAKGVQLLVIQLGKAIEGADYGKALICVEKFFPALCRSRRGRCTIRPWTLTIPPTVEFGSVNC